MRSPATYRPPRRGPRRSPAISSAVSGAIGETGRSAEAVLSASTSLTEQAARMTEEVKKFFLALRTGPMDRRKGRDPNYKGPDRREARASQAA